MFIGILANTMTGSVIMSGTLTLQYLNCKGGFNQDFKVLIEAAWLQGWLASRVGK